MLHQQKQRIEVIVRKEGGGGSTAGANELDATEIGGGANNEKYSFWLGTANRNRKHRVIKTNTTHALAIAKQVLDLEIEYWIGGMGYKSGDQAYQEQVQRNFEVVKDVTNIASSIAMGVLYGSWGGPLGALFGGAFAAISTGTSTSVKYKGRRRDFEYKTFKENNSIEYKRARASINMTSGRLR